MNKIKMVGDKILAITLSLLIMLSMGQTVHAETPAEIWVNGADISVAVNYTVQCGSGTAIYDKDTNTLTLNNAQITTANVAGYGIENKSNDDFNIVLQGSNSIDIPNTTGVFAYTEANMNFSGEGSLDIKAQQSISNHKNITFDNVTITTSTNMAGSINSDGNIIINNADISCLGTDFGFYIGGNITISNSNVTATATSNERNAFSVNGTIQIEQNSTILAKSYYPALFSRGDTTIIDSDVTAESTNDMGIWSGSNLTIGGDSEVISKGLTGSIGGNNSFKITPSLDESVEVFLGTDKDNVTALQGSPFSVETDLKALNVSNNLYFHSKTHTHTAGTEWFKDTSNHWHKCTAGDGEEMDKASHTFGEWVIDSPATETAKGSKHRDCTVCNQRETVEIPTTGKSPEKPVITAGAGSYHVISTEIDMTLTCSGKLEDLTGIYVDGKLVDESNYTLKSGSTILTLKASYLDTLSAGKHTLKFQYKDNVSAETNFTITAKETPKSPDTSTAPKTGDTSNAMLYFSLIALSGCVAGFGLKKKKALKKSR